MKQSIKNGDYYDVIELKDGLTFIDHNFFVCWLKDNTIHTAMSKDYSEILQLYKSNGAAIVFVELNSKMIIDGIARKIADYRLIDKPTEKNFKIINYRGMNVASSFFKPDYRTHLDIRFQFATIDNTLFQRLSFSFYDKSWYTSTTQYDYEVSPCKNADKLNDITIEYQHPVQQLYFLLKQFDLSPLKKSNSGEPIQELLKFYFVQKNDTNCEFSQLEKIDLSKFGEIYFID
jgi:hypothetical protein